MCPKYLYKYRPVDAHALAMLASDCVYLSPLDGFNDPFEVANIEPVLETKLAFDRDGKFAVSEEPLAEHAQAMSMRVCSLSEECQDLLMWGYYADCHRGFCIRFEFTEDPELSKMLFQVDYQPALPMSSDGCRSELLQQRRRLLIKSDKWPYEREWRIIGQAPTEETSAAALFASYRPAALTGIIFGVRMPELHKALIRKVLLNHRVQFLQAEKRHDDFALRIQPVPTDPAHD
jgi:hypothetical protein